MLGGKRMKFLAVLSTLTYGENEKKTLVLYVSSEDGRVYFLKADDNDSIPNSISNCHIHKCIGEFVTNKNNSATYFVQLNTSFTVDTLKDLFIDKE
jgi:hypothetical protein